jgi:hypothetical protein
MYLDLPDTEKAVRVNADVCHELFAALIHRPRGLVEPVRTEDHSVAPSKGIRSRTGRAERMICSLRR